MYNKLDIFCYFIKYVPIFLKNYWITALQLYIYFNLFFFLENVTKLKILNFTLYFKKNENSHFIKCLIYVRSFICYDF